jgi:RimJ/RimL family protein N-acetyltransferase
MTSPAPVLLTDRLRLRGPVRQDFADLAAMWADPEVVRFISGRPSSEGESWARLLRYIGHWHAMGFGFWIIEDRATGETLGEIGLADHRREISPQLGDSPEIGWVLKRSAQGRGVATEAARAAVAWADLALAFPRTVCIFDPDHAVSRRVAAKLGYAEAFRATFGERPTLVMERPRGG